MDAVKRKKALVIGLSITGFLLVLLVVMWTRCGVRGCPDVDQLKGYMPDEASVVLDRNGDEIGKLYVTRRVVVPLDSLPVYVGHAFVAIEDQRFWRHGGVDWRRVLGALVRNVRASMEKAINLGKNISPEVMAIIANLDDAGRLADLSASNLELKVEDAQSVLDIADTTARLRRVNDLLNKEIEVLTVQQEINTQARADIDRSQREFYLRQQLKAIQSELGEGNELGEEIAQFREKIEAVFSDFENFNDRIMRAGMTANLKHFRDVVNEVYGSDENKFRNRLFLNVIEGNDVSPENIRRFFARMEYKPGREFFLADAYWLPPDGDPIGPMALEARCTPQSAGTLLHLRQSGHDATNERWTRYYDVMSSGWLAALHGLKRYLERRFPDE